jgi:hypothetical protein
VAEYLSIESVTTMAFIEIPPPGAWKRVFLEGLGANDSLQLNYSLPVYALSLEELGKADPIRPTALGWQFLTIDSKGFVCGEVSNQPDDPGGEVATSLTRGTAIDECWKAYEAVKQHPEVLNEPFELRRLRISPLRIDAFWLKALPSDDVLGASDRVYPFVAFDERLKSQLLSAPAFLTIVRQLAAKAIVQETPRRTV